MNLKQLRREFRQGRIQKQIYIEKMHKKHRLLFEYADYIGGTDIGSIEIGDGEVIVTTRERGVRMHVDCGDKRIAPVEILNFSDYEREELKFIERLLDDQMTIFDIGANTGWYTINIARMNPRATLHAFEPIPKTFLQLEKNVALNEIKTANLYNFGFSDKSDTLTFHYCREVSGNASLNNLSGRKDVEEIRCPVMRLDEFMADKPFAIDLMKCDVEGAELFVFQGGVKTILAHRPVIFTEMLRKWSRHFGYHPNDIISFLGNMGYRCFAIREGWIEALSAVTDSTIETNFFFLHREKHRGKIETLRRK